MKLISDLKLGDKIFVIDRSKCTFNVAEVDEVLNVSIRLLFYLNDTYNIYYIWKYSKSKHTSGDYTFFTDEIEAVEEFKQLLWLQ